MNPIFTFTTISIVLFATTVVNALIAVTSWQRRNSRTGLYLALALTFVTGWILAAAFDYAAVLIPLKVFFAKWEYTAYNLAFLFFIAFSLTFAGFGHWLKKIRVRAYLGILIASNILLAWTNDWHGWLWSGFTKSEFGNNTIIFEHGPGYLWVVATGYLMIAVVIIPFGLMMLRGSGILRKQARVLFIATLVPILANLVYNFGPVELRGVEWTQATFSITGLLFVYALYGVRLVDLVPIARDKVLAGMSDGTVVLDLQDRILDINQVAAKMFASSPENLIGNNILDIIPSARPLKEQPIKKDIRTEFLVEDTGRRYFDVLISPLFDDHGKVIGRLVVFRDITERKENELRLLQLTQAVEQSPSSVVVTDLEGNITYINSQFTRLTGYAFDEVIGQNLRVLQSGQMPDEVYQDLWQTIKSGSVWRGEFLNQKKDGELYWEYMVMTSVLDADGQTINFVAVKNDITEQKRAERGLVEREHRFRRLYETSPVAIMIMTLEEGRLLDANEAYWKLSGRDPKTSIGKTIIELRKGFESDRRREFVNTLIEKKSIKNPAYTFVDEAGNHHPALAFFELIEFDGKPTVFSMFYDMTEQVNAQSALRRSEARFRLLLEAAPDSILFVKAGIITFANTKCEDVFGYSKNEIIDQPLELLLPERFKRTHQMHVGNFSDYPENRQMKQVSHKEFVGRRKNGDEFPVDISLGPIEMEGDTIIAAVVRDDTERRETEKERENLIAELEKRNAESESLRETATIVASTLEISDVVQRVLQQMKRVIDYDSASVWLYKGRYAYLVGGDNIPDLPEEYRQYTLSEMNPDYPLWSQKLPYILYDDIQKEYEIFREPPINYIHGWVAVPLTVHERLTGFISMDSKQIGYFSEDDAQLALTYANQVSIALENARLFSSLQDELYERQELINQLDAKNADLERFTYAVSHDLKSPLLTAKWFLDYLKDDIASGNEKRVQTDLQRMNDAMDIMQKRVGGILEIARAGWLSGTDEVIDLNELVAEAVELVHGRISQRGITVRVQEDLSQIRGNRSRLLDVFQNLIDNAAKFMGDVVDPKIEIGQQGMEGENPVFFVKDNGMGIAPEQHERVFGIFNKLNPTAEGTGIGLSLVKKTIEAHGGRVWVESEMGKGSTFYFTLPGK